MRLLLDTHALLWLMVGDARLTTAARVAIVQDAEVIHVSAASAWEICTKHRLGRLPSARALALGFDAMVKEANLVALPITTRHGQAAGNLDGSHKDPFDRMLIAQALLENLTLVSNEAVFDSFGVARLW